MSQLEIWMQIAKHVYPAGDGQRYRVMPRPGGSMPPTIKQSKFGRNWRRRGDQGESWFAVISSTGTELANHHGQVGTPSHLSGYLGHSGGRYW